MSHINQQDKFLLIYLFVILIVYISVIFYFDHEIGVSIFPESGSVKLYFSENVDLNRERIYSVMANIENYPQILPENYVSVIINNKTSNTIYSEEEVSESGIRTKMLVKHILIPNRMHELKVLSGDARGTNITVLYDIIDNSHTKITTEAQIKVHGILLPFAYLAQDNIKHALNSIITSFVNYAKNETNFSY